MATVNMEMVKKIAEKIKEMPIAEASLTFTEGGMFPPEGDPGTLDYFFATIMQNYGFWIGDRKGYVKPLYGEIDGKILKGADLLWTLSMKIYRERGPEFFRPKNLSALKFRDFCRWFPEEYEFQDLPTRWRMALNYGTHCVRKSVEPETLLKVANHCIPLLKGFLELTLILPGYGRDFLMKKNILLAMALANRPERFLKVGPDEKWPPIVDYHLMRVSERLGTVDLEPREYELLVQRAWVPIGVECSVRLAVSDAVAEIIRLSGKPMNKVDFLLWSARKYCLEMETPDCFKCVFDDICAKRVELFQPVFKTTNY